MSPNSISCKLGPDGSRYRWIGEGADGARTRSIEDGAYTVTSGRYTGAGVTLYGRGEPVAVSRSAGGGGRRGAGYLGKDVLGSVRSVTGEYGTLEDRYEYDAFGKPYQGDLDGGMNLGYTGKPYDGATGFYNYGYRDYSPLLARFTTIDPVRDGSNWFAYVNNDPVNWRDELGLYIINDITNGPTAAYDYQNNHDGQFDLGLGGFIPTTTTSGKAYPTGQNIQLPNDLNSALNKSNSYQRDNNPNTITSITSKTNELGNGNFEISINVQNTTINPDGTINMDRPSTGVIAYANPGEVMNKQTGEIDPESVNAIANEVINYVNHTPKHDNNLTYDCGR
jgi:RHS repeat-associated protein